MIRRKSLTLYAVLYSIHYLVITKGGPVCLKCDRVRQPFDCSNVVMCGNHEMCSIRKYIMDDGHVWFDVGCLDAQRCGSLPFGKRLSSFDKADLSEYEKRNAGETTECEMCCKADICNKEGLCGAQTLQQSGQYLCFKCDSEQGPDTCNTITMCSHDEVCFIQSINVGLSGSKSWVTGCKRKDACAHFTQVQGSNCHSCCSTDVCNRQCPAGITSINIRCPTGWYTHSQSCYLFHVHPLNWIHAEAFCQAQSSHLATVETSAENSYLIQQLTILGANFEAFWIGGNDIQQEGVFKWSSTGMEVHYFDWFQNGIEPNDLFGAEDCVCMRNGYKWHWNDDNCNAVFPFICERDDPGFHVTYGSDEHKTAMGLNVSNAESWWGISSKNSNSHVVCKEKCVG